MSKVVYPESLNKSREERRYIIANVVVYAVFHDMYVVNNCLNKPIKY